MLIQDLEVASYRLKSRDKEQPDRYTYDPENPVPTRGGAVLYAAAETEGPRDQREIEERSDVLVYTSEPLKGATGGHRACESCSLGCYECQGH